MQYTHKKNIGCGLLIAGIIMAPLLPFWGLLLIPLLVLWCGLPVGAILFSILLDSFLAPGGVTPMWTSLTFCTMLSLPLYLYVRYTTTL